ncbi:unnamed protein product [Effrenium voratum]|uniref:Uncharacterized protein n=1 Tax=Effrenium voratum TaxID=2562239 RepID=A0AA36IGH8_9DINO|nr:unnamed protein product [Effrenium voratum]CAJ1452544.1 unnamed protein product [Effrenium voratum]
MAVAFLLPSAAVTPVTRVPVTPVTPFSAVDHARADWAPKASLAFASLAGFGAARAQAARAQAARRAASRRREACLGGVLAAAPQVASAKTKQEAVEKLDTYALSSIAPTEEAPSGWQWVVEGLGLTADAYMNNQKFKGGEPTIVRFLCPPFWSVAKPQIDYNGASGTVQINNYAKGDSATVFVDAEFKGNVADMQVKEAKATLFRALTLKGTSSLQGLKVNKVSEVEGLPNYKLVDFEWTLFTGAGFEIDRDGFAMITQISPGGPLQVFWGGVVSTRYREMKDTLLDVVKSFRAAKVPEGIKIELKKEFKDFDVQFREER